MEIKKNIVLLDDHVIIRNGLKELIEKLGPYKISGEFGNGAEFLEAIIKKTDTDLIILDINMPGMNGDEVMKNLTEKGVQIPVLVLTVNDSEEMIIQLFRLGVRGYLRKNCDSSELKVALNAILNHGYYHNDFLTYSLRTNLNEVKKSEQELILEKLSPREKGFLKLVCHEKEYTYDQISDLMNVNLKTVHGYRESLFDKLKIKSKTGLVLFVLKHNLFDYL